ETLRTTFASVEGVPVPVIAERGSVFVKTIDLRDYPADERDSAALQMAIEESHRPFDLSHGPLVRAMLLQLDEAEYMLLLNMHHIVSDGWSHGVFVRELAALYEAFVTNQDDPPSKLPPLPIQYTDFAVWQQQRLSGAVLAEQVNYWKQQLASIVTLDLPTDRPRPALQTHNGAVEWVTVPKALTDRLNELSQQENATLFMTLLAAYNVVLAKYSGQLDVPVGTFISNRNRAEIEGLIGFFVNTLVLRADLSGNPTLREIVQRVRKVALDAYAHQDLPFEKLLDELNPVRDTSRSPFFQTMLVLQNASTGTLELPGLLLRRVDVDSGTARFDLMLVLHETERGLEGAAEFNTDLFEARTINRMVEHLQIVLETLVRDPDRRLLDLSLLTTTEQHQLFDVWNATQRPFSQATIHALFEEQAARTPDKIAVSAEGQMLSYRELNELANQLAHTLRSLDVGPGMLIGACLDRTPELLVGVLGILKSGAAYLPLDPDYPPSRLAFMLEDAQIALLVGHQALIDQLPANSARTLCLDGDALLINGAAVENPRPVTAAEDLAYVLYTSGSTGQPKGAQIPHRAVINFLESMREQPGLTADDILLAVTSLSFDIAGLELYLPLLTGAQVALVSRNVASDGEQLRDQLAATGATVMQATPSTWRLLLHAGWKGSPTLKVLCGGEALPLDLARPLIAGNAELWNLYGPTETTIWSAVSQVDLDEDLITIGHPIANTQIYLLDPKLQPVPIGVAGELHIGGDGLSWGYLKRPALTADKFIPDPFSKQ
ncbi:MAG TPA: amino acid adenylation domain-containing protein, partial [Herpetosiphonaceae bacterium]